MADKKKTLVDKTKEVFEKVIHSDEAPNDDVRDEVSAGDDDRDPKAYENHRKWDKFKSKGDVNGNE